MSIFGAILDQTEKMAPGPWRDTLEKIKQKAAERATARRIKNGENWEIIGYVLDKKKTAKGLKGEEALLVTKDGRNVPVMRYIGWDNGKKYTVEKLRDIRKLQCMQLIAGKTHFQDGTPIVQDRLVDLW